MSLYGYDKKTTPVLDRFAEEAVVFEEAISTSSWTIPSHASLFTGKWIFQHGAHTHHKMLSPQHNTLAEYFLQAGYNTAGFVGGPYMKSRYGMDQGFINYKQRLDFFEHHTLFEKYSIRRLLDFISPALTLAVLGTDGENTAPEINSYVAKWLKTAKDKPFFLFVNYFDAHDPYNLGQQYRSTFTQETKYSDQEVDALIEKLYYGGELRYINYPVEPGLQQYMQAVYETEIYFLDKQIAELISLFRKHELMENTLFVITADHGEEFFEHGGVQHRQTLFREVIRVPLLFRYPSLFPARRIEQPVSTVHLFSTLLDFAGVSVQEELPAKSLLPILTQTGKAKETELILSELRGTPLYGGIDVRSLQENHLKLIEAEQQTPRLKSGLYNLKLDPQELSPFDLSHEDALKLKTQLDAMDFDMGQEETLEAK